MFKNGKCMEEFVRMNDLVLIFFLEFFLKDVDIKYFVVDGNMSILEGFLVMIFCCIFVDVD